MDGRERLRYAQYVATQEHVIKRSQLYSGTLPYTHHLAAVEAVLYAEHLHLELDFDLRVAAWLHDIVEDCEGFKFKNVAEMFGERVHQLVWAVTNEPGPNRASRHAMTYPKIRQTPDAILVKLADRIANVQAGGRLIAMYRKEHEDFKRMLYGSATSSDIHHQASEELWEQLDNLIDKAD